MEGWKGMCGEGSSAQFLGEFEAEDFRDACFKWAKTREHQMDYFDDRALSYWGCRLFDNEQDARKSFG